MELRIVTWNVHFGKKTDLIIEIFKKHPALSKADIIFFQEIEDHEAEMISRAQKIAAALAFESAYAPARKLTHRPWPHRGTHGLAIVSRFPLSDIATLTLPRYRILPRTRNRIAMVATADVKGVPIRLANLHLDTRIRSEKRLAQLHPLIDSFKDDAHGKVILGGDFNTFNATQKNAIQQYLLEEQFLSHVSDTRYTLSRGIVRLDLDAIYVRNITTVASGVETDVFVSDHKPLWLDVEI